MKYILALTVLVASVYGEVVVTTQAQTAAAVATAPAVAPNNPIQTNLMQEVVIGNKDPISVKVTNLKLNDIQNVRLDRNDTINVVVENELKLVDKQKSKLLALHESVDAVIVENGTYLGGLNTDTQNIFVYKTTVAQGVMQQTGMIIKFIADSKLEVSKDIKIIVENELYVDEKEIAVLQEALSKMISVASQPNETKDYRIVFNFLDNGQISSYSIKKMLSSSKGAEVSFVAGKDKRYSSKTTMTIKELIELKAIVDKFASTTLESI